jgi:cytochrome c oxidase cbb3-type subunit III
MHRVAIAVTLIFAFDLTAQPPAGAAGGRGGFVSQFPDKPRADAVVVARGRNIYDTNCSFCHGEDARGGEEGGPNLIRSEILLRDQNGELLVPIVQNGLPDRGMPKFTLNTQQISDIAAFIHSFGISSRDPGRKRPPSIVVGDARAGESYFKTKCASCHSPFGDLRGIGTRISDPRILQQTWLMPVVSGGRGAGPTAPAKVIPITVTVTLDDGQKIDGRLGRIDDFIVTLTQADGATRSFRRDGGSPQIEVHDPLQPHKELLRVYSDKDIHDVTAYLVTIR